MLIDGEFAQVVKDRLDRELGVIGRLGFANYFLIVWDFVRYSREKNVPATARGSGVGALSVMRFTLATCAPLNMTCCSSDSWMKIDASAGYRYRLL